MIYLLVCRKLGLVVTNILDSIKEVVFVVIDGSNKQNFYFIFTFIIIGSGFGIFYTGSVQNKKLITFSMISPIHFNFFLNFDWIC